MFLGIINKILENLVKQNNKRLIKITIICIDIISRNVFISKVISNIYKISILLEFNDYNRIIIIDSYTRSSCKS